MGYTSEQRRIAVVLDTVDEAITETNALIMKLKQVRAGLLHGLLTCGLDEHDQLRDPIAHSEQFQDSHLGRIPKGWEVMRLGSCAQFVTSGSRGWAIAMARDAGMMVIHVVVAFRPAIPRSVPATPRSAR